MDKMVEKEESDSLVKVGEEGPLCINNLKNLLKTGAIFQSISEIL